MKKILLLFVLSSISLSTITAGGPWPQLKGKGYFKLSEWWVIFDQHYTDQGLIDPNVTTGVFNTSLYAEYGLTDRLTGIVNTPLLSRNYMNNIVSNTTQEVITPGEAINTIGDIDLGIKYGLTPAGSKFPIAASLILGLPTGTLSGGTQNNLQTGDGEFNQFLKIDAGTSFSLQNKNALYVAGYLGFNNRTNDFSDEYRLGLETGVGLMNQKLWLTGKLDIVESLKNGATAETTTSTSIFANNAEFTSVTLEANYYLMNRIGLSASIGSAVRGEIIAAAPSYSLGVFFDMSK